MPRSRRALVAAAVAMIALGGALVTSAAGAASAHAATAAAPVSHTMTVTAQRNSGISPRDILPCAVPAPTSSPSQVTPASCGLPPVITCWITVSVPVVTSSKTISAGASVHCDSPISAIRLTEDLYKGNSTTPVSESQDFPVNDANAFGAVGGGKCQPVTYFNVGFAGLDFPAGYTPSSGSIHDTESLTPSAKACGTTSGGGGGGGGGGCAITAPSSSAQPAADLPRLIACP